MIGFYNYTVILTYIGTVCGFVGITYVIGSDPKAALLCLILAGICDMFDGKIASTMKRTKSEKRFGVQIDSLSDLICFGVLPSVIVFQLSDRSVLNIIFSAIYLLCALIRLAWFNVDEEQRQDTEEKSRDTFRGLPVTTSAILIPVLVALIVTLKLPVGKICPWLLFAIGIAFLTPFSMKKPKLVGKIIMLVCGVVGFILLLFGVKI